VTALRFETLVTPHLQELRRFALHLERDPVQGDDLLQHALERGLVRLHQLRDEAAFKGWMSRIVYTTWLDVRRKKRETPLEQQELERRRVSVYGPEHALADRRLGRRIAAALGNLPEAQREAVWLVDGLGFKFGEAAEMMGVPPGTVASRVARARAVLREELAELAPRRWTSR